MLIKQNYEFNIIIKFFNSLNINLKSNKNKNYLSNNLNNSNNNNNNNNKNNNNNNKYKKFLFFIFSMVLLFIIFYLINYYFSFMPESFYAFMDLFDNNTNMLNNNIDNNLFNNLDENTNNLSKDKEFWISWILELFKIFIINITSNLPLFFNYNSYNLLSFENENLDSNFNEENNNSTNLEDNKLKDFKDLISKMDSPVNSNSSNNGSVESLQDNSQENLNSGKGKNRMKDSDSDIIESGVHDPVKELSVNELYALKAAQQQELAEDDKIKQIAEAKILAAEAKGISKSSVYITTGLDTNQRASIKVMIGHIEDELWNREREAKANGLPFEQPEAGPSTIISKQPKSQPEMVTFKSTEGESRQIYTKLPEDLKVKPIIVNNQTNQEDQTDNNVLTEDKKCSWWCFWKK
jgi:hypothetical protein